MTKIGVFPTQDIGYVNHCNGGGWAAGNPDTGLIFSWEKYVVLSGLSGYAMLGEYRIFTRNGYGPIAIGCTLTATIEGAVVWFEHGVLEGSSTTMQNDDDRTNDGSTSARRLFTDGVTSIFASYTDRNRPETDVFMFTHES